ncbi:MAG TPA: cohesin domain-containing protein [Candidatus Saccharimonadales bacterium]
MNYTISRFKFLNVKSLLLLIVPLGFATVGINILSQSHAAAIPSVVTNTSVTPIYRFYRLAGGHFFTSSKPERNTVISTNSGYSYEGTAYYAHTAQVAGSSPIYRLYDKVRGYHFYTVNFNEYNSVAAQTNAYRNEGIAYYGMPNSGDGLTAVYRLYNLNQGIHFYTTTASEKEILAAQLNTYRYEGIAYYVPDSVGAPAANSLYVSPRLASIKANDIFTVSVRTNTVDKINTAQASIQFDPTKVQYVSVQNTSLFSQIAATDTRTPGLIRIARGTPSASPQNGDSEVVRLTFRMLSVDGRATLSLDPNATLGISAADNTNVLNVISNSDFWSE